MKTTNTIKEWCKDNGLRMDRIAALYDYLDLDCATAPTDWKNDYLTDNVGRDGMLYYWYMDTVTSGAIRVSDGHILTSESLQEVFNF